MSSINKVILVGHLGKDPEVRHLEGGTTVASFSLATSESYTNKSGERVDSTEWHNIVCWRGLAEVAEKYLKKGKLIYVEGKIRSRNYEDKEGIKRYITEIYADNFQMLGPKGDSGNESSNNSYEKAQSKAPSTENAPDPVGDDLPF